MTINAPAPALAVAAAEEEGEEEEEGLEGTGNRCQVKYTISIGIVCY